MWFQAKSRFLAILMGWFKVDPRSGLGKTLFEALSELTPIVNIELIVSDTNARVALVYRDDEFYGPGWHLPGGVLRFKENLVERVHRTASKEVGCKNLTDLVFLNHFEVFAANRDTRGHFISFLFSAVDMKLVELENFESNKNYKHGDAAMFSNFPENIIPQHSKYGKYLENIFKT